MTDLADIITAFMPKAEGNPAAMMRLVHMLRRDGRQAEAYALCRRALALAPENMELAAEARALFADAVPQWHFGIVRDARRNAAYDAALRRAVRPGSRVLEIGTGTGLLAMMAARAGARLVVSCETIPAIAEMAGEIVARNGYADRVRIVAKHSDELHADADLGGRADILVSEIVSNDLLNEGILFAHERAVRDLLVPGGAVIPASGRIRVALADDPRNEEAQLGEIDGFDLSPFNRAGPSVRYLKAGDKRLALRSEGADLFEFDFGSSRFHAPARTSVACRSLGGSVNGIVQWIALKLDEEASYENRPGPGARSCWAVVFHPLPRPIDTSAGQECRISGSHDRRRVLIWLDTQ